MHVCIRELIKEEHSTVEGLTAANHAAIYGQRECKAAKSDTANKG